MDTHTFGSLLLLHLLLSATATRLSSTSTTLHPTTTTATTSLLTLNTRSTTDLDRSQTKRSTLEAQLTVEQAWSPTVKWQWTDPQPKGMAPVKREGHSSVSLDNMLVVFGGCYLDKQCFNDVHVYFSNKQLWVPVKTVGLPPAEREGHTATMVGDHMFVYGGSSQLGYLGDVFVLKTSLSSVGSGEELTMAWGRPDMSLGMEDAPPGREGHTATLVDARIFYIGGYTEKGFTNELMVLDTALMSWEQPRVSSLKPPAREGHSANLYNKRIYVWGGFTDGGCLQDLWILDTNTLAWEVGTAMGMAPVAREDHASVVRGNELLVAAGCNFGKRNCFADLHVLNMDDMLWREEIIDSVGTTTLTPRESVSMNIVGGEIYMFGGCYLSQQCFGDLVILQPSEGSLKCGGDSPEGTCSGHGECRVYLEKKEEEEVPAEESEEEGGESGESGAEGDASGPAPPAPAVLLQVASTSTTKKGFIKTLLQDRVGPKTPPPPIAASGPGAPVEVAAASGASGATGTTLAPLSGASGAFEAPEEPGDPSDFTATYMCQCESGFQGEQCELHASCPFDCSGHGTCVAGGYCLCVLSWIGRACERRRQLPLASCPNSCSGHGKCHAPHSEEPLVNVTAAVVAAPGPALPGPALPGLAAASGPAAFGPAASGPAASGPAAPAAAVVPPALRFKETNLHLRSAVPLSLQVQQGSSTNQAVSLIETSTQSTQSIQFMTRRGQRRTRGLFKTTPAAPTTPTVAPPIAPPTAPIAPIAPIDPPFPPPADALAAPSPDDEDDDDEAVCVCDDEWSGAACDLNQPTDAAPALNASATPTTPPTATPPTATPPAATPPAATPPAATPPAATPPGVVGHSFKRVHSHTKVVTDLAADVLAAVAARNKGQTSPTAPTVTIAPPLQTTPPTRTSAVVPTGDEDGDGDGDDDTSATKAQDCRDNKKCNNQKNGVCKENRCYCLAGFTGDDCLASTTTHLSRRLKSFVSFDSSWHWVTVSLILGTFLGFMSDPVKRVCGQKSKFRRGRKIHR